MELESRLRATEECEQGNDYVCAISDAIRGGEIQKTPVDEIESDIWRCGVESSRYLFLTMGHAFMNVSSQTIEFVAEFTLTHGLFRQFSAYTERA